MIKRSERCAWAGNEQSRAREVVGVGAWFEVKDRMEGASSREHLLPKAASSHSVGADDAIGGTPAPGPSGPQTAGLLPMKTPPSES